jgi:DNA polymerase
MQVFDSIEKQESMDVLNYQIRACEQCILAKTRRQPLVGEGPLQASVFVVALSPGRKEDEQNKMFVGPSGKVFDRLLKASGIERESLYMSNLIKCMLPKNRKPKTEEIELCSQFLEDEIAIVRPQIIVPLGFYATQLILKKLKADSREMQLGFKQINGHLLKLNGLAVFPLTHPSALLYNPSFEPGTIEKYKKLKSLLEGIKPGGKVT